MRASRVDRLAVSLATALWIPGLAGVNAQNSWMQSTGPPGGHVQSIAIATDGTIYGGTSNRGVFKSVDDGTRWVAMGLEDLDVRVVVANDPDVVHAGTYGAGVLLSTDGGASWSRHNVGLLDTRVQAMVSTAEGDLLLGTRGFGAFRSTDGSLWTAASNGLSEPDVRAVALDGAGNAYAATFGYGVHRSEDLAASWSIFDGGSGMSALRFVIATSQEVVAAGWNGGVARHDGSGWTNISRGLPND